MGVLACLFSQKIRYLEEFTEQHGLKNQWVSWLVLLAKHRRHSRKQLELCGICKSWVMGNLWNLGGEKE